MQHGRLRAQRSRAPRKFSQQSGKRALRARAAASARAAARPSIPGKRCVCYYCDLRRASTGARKRGGVKGCDSVVQLALLVLLGRLLLLLFLFLLLLLFLLFLLFLLLAFGSLRLFLLFLLLLFFLFLLLVRNGLL